jgi:diketogulonate reductase-like aldo/keto reductase
MDEASLHAVVDQSRRKVLKVMGLGVGALAVPGLIPVTAARAQPADLILRAIPRTGEQVPAIGLGTHMAFDVKPGKPRDHLREVLRIFYEGGGRVVDVSPLYGMAEVNVGDFATALGITDELFMAGKIWATGEWLGDDSQALRQLQRSMERLWRDRFDLMQCHSLVNAPVIMNLLADWKAEGHIRYLGVTHHLPAEFHALAPWVEQGKVDFVQLRYNIATRAAEQRLLPAAQDTGTAVLVNMPFEKARLFQIVKGQALPDFSKEIGVQSWAQFYLKWVISHPAVTCVIPATTNPKHQADNIAALKGPLPDADLRARMLAHMESLPGFAEVAKQPAYPDKTFDGVVERPGAKR